MVAVAHGVLDAVGEGATELITLQFFLHFEFSTFSNYFTKFVGILLFIYAFLSESFFYVFLNYVS